MTLLGMTDPDRGYYESWMLRLRKAGDVWLALERPCVRFTDRQEQEETLQRNIDCEVQ